MTQLKIRPSQPLLPITWEKLAADFVLPDEPVESTLQPLLAAALRESLELAGLIVESMLIASNFGICATVGERTVVKAPDWVFIPAVEPLPAGEIRRSFTPHAEGEIPAIVMEFISETEGGEYSINPHYPYGKWYFYEQILQVPVYVIFHPKTGALDVYRLMAGKYELQQANASNLYWLEEIGLFLGCWPGKKAELTGYWLRWWDESGNLLLWGSELVAQERQRTAQERQRAEQAEQQTAQERQRAEQAEQKAEELAARLRAMGSEP
jgi:Uma2 family endonuclease